MAQEPPNGWGTGTAKCRLCTHVWTAVFPFGANEYTLECPSCGTATGQLQPLEETETETESDNGEAT